MGCPRPILAPEQEGDQDRAIGPAAYLVATSGNGLPNPQNVPRGAPAQKLERLIQRENTHKHSGPPRLDEKPTAVVHHPYREDVLVFCVRKAMPPLLLQARDETHEPLRGRNAHRRSDRVDLNGQLVMQTFDVRPAVPVSTPDPTRCSG